MKSPKKPKPRGTTCRAIQRVPNRRHRLMARRTLGTGNRVLQAGGRVKEVFDQDATLPATNVTERRTNRSKLEKAVERLKGFD